MSPYWIDQTCFWTAAILPVLLVARFRWVGFAAGAFCVWGILDFEGTLLSKVDPNREAAIIDLLWRRFGWIAGLVYCLPILIVREGIAWIIRRHRRRPLALQ